MYGILYVQCNKISLISEAQHEIAAENYWNEAILRLLSYYFIEQNMSIKHLSPAFGNYTGLQFCRMDI